jgi:hypothetical protein
LKPIETYTQYRGLILEVIPFFFFFFV